MGAANASCTATWYDTSTGDPVRAETVQANGAGEVTLAVTPPATDTAVQLEGR